MINSHLFIISVLALFISSCDSSNHQAGELEFVKFYQNLSSEEKSLIFGRQSISLHDRGYGYILKVTSTNCPDQFFLQKEIGSDTVFNRDLTEIFLISEMSSRKPIINDSCSCSELLSWVNTLSALDIVRVEADDYGVCVIQKNIGMFFIDKNFERRIQESPFFKDTNRKERMQKINGIHWLPIEFI